MSIGTHLRAARGHHGPVEADGAQLGRFVSDKDPLQLRKKRALDARALGDLSGFPALRELTFSSCEVMLCASMLGAVQHPASPPFAFLHAHPAPECAPVVLQLSRALRRLSRGSVLTVRK